MKTSTLIIITFIITLSTINGYSQPASLYGIPFGSTMAQVERVLDSKFFKGKYISPDEKNLEYHDVDLAGVIFGSLIIEFTQTLQGNVMTKAFLMSNYKLNSKQAIIDRDKIAKQLSEKYKFIKSEVNSSGFKNYQFGFNKNHLVGLLSIYPLVAPDGKTIERYYLEISYNPRISSSSDL